MKNAFLVAGVALVTLASCATNNTKTYSIDAKSGTETKGTAKFTQGKDGVEMDLNVTNLTPGTHAVHIHEFGDCSAPDASSAGGHWNPTTEDHGKWGDNQHHMGDIGNLVAKADGTAKLVFKTDKWCLDCTDTNKNITGHAIVIHEKADDFQTQPTGDAGGRVGCIEIK